MYVHVFIPIQTHMYVHVAVTVLFVRTVKPFPSISLQFFNKPTPLTIAGKQQQQRQREQQEQQQQ